MRRRARGARVYLRTVARSRVDGDDARAAVYGQVRRHRHRQTQMVVKAVDAVDEEEMEQARQRADRVVRQRYATRSVVDSDQLFS